MSSATARTFEPKAVAMERAQRKPGRKRLGRREEYQLGAIAFDAYFANQGVAPYRAFADIGRVAQRSWIASAIAVSRAVGGSVRPR
jgi:hypothetical protein